MQNKLQNLKTIEDALTCDLCDDVRALRLNTLSNEQVTVDMTRLPGYCDLRLLTISDGDKHQMFNRVNLKINDITLKIKNLNNYITSAIEINSDITDISSKIANLEACQTYLYGLYHMRTLLASLI